MNSTQRSRVARFLCSLVLAVLPLAGFAQPAAQGGPHDFDFEFGMWQAHLARLVHPLTGSKEWTHLAGPSVVRKVWNGRANLGEIELDGPSGHIEGLSLRLYDPQTRQWSIRFSNSRDGELGEPMIGGFKDGRGEFFDRESFHGRMIDVRFVFSNITRNAFRFEQSFSADGGKTWEPNWIATFTRVTSL